MKKKKIVLTSDEILSIYNSLVDIILDSKYRYARNDIEIVLDIFKDRIKLSKFKRECYLKYYTYKRKEN